MKAFVVGFIVLWHVLAATGSAQTSGAYRAQEFVVKEPSANGTQAVTIKAPSLSSSWSWTMPTDDGTSGQLLSTDGSGVMSWISPLTNPMDSAGDMIYGGSGGTATKLDSGTSGQVLVSGGAGAMSWSNTMTTGKVIDGSADEIQLRVQGNGTQTTDTFVIEKSNGDDLFAVSETGVTAFGTNTSGALISNTASSTSSVTYGFIGDPNTGMMSPGSDNLSLVTGGTTRLTATNTGINIAGTGHGVLYAAASDVLSETALSPARGGTGVANNSAATLTRSGNHALTLTTTGTTGVTLPTSGTLMAGTSSAAWSPAPEIQSSNADLTINYSARQAYYATFGSMVFVTGVISWDTCSGGTGTMRIINLPVAAASASNNYSSCSFTASRLDYTTNYTTLTGLIAPGATRIDIYQTGDAQAAATTGLTTLACGAPVKEIDFTCTYFAN